MLRVMLCMTMKVSCTSSLRPHTLVLRRGLDQACMPFEWHWSYFSKKIQLKLENTTTTYTHSKLKLTLSEPCMMPSES